VLPAEQCDVIRTDHTGEHSAFCLLIIGSITADASYRDGVEKQIHVCTERPSDCHRQNAVILSQGLFGTEHRKIGQSAGTEFDVSSAIPILRPHRWRFTFLCSPPKHEGVLWSGLKLHTVLTEAK
jgi:hypothetical protein